MPRIASAIVISAALLAAIAGSARGQTSTQPAPAGRPDRDEVRAIVAEVMADAETRSSLLADGATAGNDGKFFIASPDGSMRLNIGGDLQFRYVMNFRGTSNTIAAPNKGDDFDPGFQDTRIRLHFDGSIGKDWGYKLLTRNDASGNVLIEEAWFTYNFGNGWKALGGQFKIPLLHEELVSSVKQLATERSVVNSAFTQLRSQGVQIGYDTTDWNFKFAFSDGLASENTDFTNQAIIASSAAGAPFKIVGEADWALTGRFEYKFAGSWDQYADFTSTPKDEFAAVLGVAGHFQESPNTSDPADVDMQTLEYTADLQIKSGGWSLYGAFIGRHNEFRGSGAGNDSNFDDFGGLVQGAYRWGDAEVFARWDAIFPDSDRNLNEDAYHFVTAGLNYYFAGHAAKFTADAMIALNKTGDISGVPATATGGSVRILPNTNEGLLGSNDEDEVVVRLQFQLLF